MSAVNNWQRKFSVAIAGVAWSIRTQTSFWIHLPIAMAVIAVAAWLQVEPWRWAAVITAIVIVFTAELLNTAIEQLVRVLHPEHDERIGSVLDAAAGAVLVASLGAVVLGVLALGPPLLNVIVTPA